MKSAIFLLSLVAYASAFELTVVHFNDIHSYFDQQTMADGRACTKARSAAGGSCFGGLARLVTKVKEIRAQKENVLFLFGGDSYVGTPWFTMFKDEVVTYFMNRIGLDTQALGNHEFDYGPEGLSPFLKNATFTTLCANIDLENEPLLKDYVQPSQVFQVGGKKVGIIGYITPDTEFLSSPGETVEFSSDIEALSKEAQKLKDDGVEIILALGHSGYVPDQEIGKKVKHLDAVIGGHSHTFLASEGQGQFPDDPSGPYPTVVKQEDGTEVPVVQAYMNGKYLGNITFNFDDEGNLESWEGAPIFLDSSVEKDPEIEADLQVWREEVGEAIHVKIGRTLSKLDGERTHVRLRETNLGDFITDGLLAAAHKNGFKDVTIALQNSGGIRNSIKKGEITLEDAMLVAPFGNTLDIVTLQGKYLYDVFEHSVSGVESVEGRFLQVSGIWVTYDSSQEVGKRVKSLKVRNTGHLFPLLTSVDMEKNYTIIVPGYTRRGGDGYDVLRENSEVIEETDWMDLDLLTDYIKEKSPVFQWPRRRIVFENEKKHKLFNRPWRNV